MSLGDDGVEISSDLKARSGVTVPSRTRIVESRDSLKKLFAR